MTEPKVGSHPAYPTSSPRKPQKLKNSNSKITNRTGRYTRHRRKRRVGFLAQYAMVVFKISSDVPSATGNDPATDLHMIKTESLRVDSLPPLHRVSMA
jgi:hypothetical protein